MAIEKSNEGRRDVVEFVFQAAGAFSRASGQASAGTRSQARSTLFFGFLGRVRGITSPVSRWTRSIRFTVALPTSKRSAVDVGRPARPRIVSDDSCAQITADLRGRHVHFFDHARSIASF